MHKQLLYKLRANKTQQRPKTSDRPWEWLITILGCAHATSGIALLHGAGAQWLTGEETSGHPTTPTAGSACATWAVGWYRYREVSSSVAKGSPQKECEDSHCQAFPITPACSSPFPPRSPSLGTAGVTAHAVSHKPFPGTHWVIFRDDRTNLCVK